MAKTAKTVDPAIIQEGWEALVKEMGIDKATRFVVAFERGEGGTVREIKRFWRGKSLNEIYRTVRRVKINS